MSAEQLDDRETSLCACSAATLLHLREDGTLAAHLSGRAAARSGARGQRGRRTTSVTAPSREKKWSRFQITMTTATRVNT